MPFAPVDEFGTEYCYVDSGPPRTSYRYTTLVLIHGAGFQSCELLLTPSIFVGVVD